MSSTTCQQPTRYVWLSRRLKLAAHRAPTAFQPRSTSMATPASPNISSHLHQYMALRYTTTRYEKRIYCIHLQTKGRQKRLQQLQRNRASLCRRQDPCSHSTQPPNIINHRQRAARVSMRLSSWPRHCRHDLHALPNTGEMPRAQPQPVHHLHRPHKSI